MAARPACLGPLASRTESVAKVNQINVLVYWA
jgi:hypothetical protein